MIYGLDVLGVAKYSQVALNNWPQNFACGCFAQEFGDVFSFLDKLLATGKCPQVRIQLLWSDQHQYGSAQDQQAIAHLAQRYNQLAVKYPTMRIELSPYCEHQLSNPDFHCGIVAKNAPNCIPINTPEPGGAWSTQFKNETHGGGLHPNPTNRSGDGGINGHDDIDLDITSEKNKHLGADVFYFWCARFNGHWSMHNTTPRPQRADWPDAQFINAVAFLATDIGATNVPKGWCIKSNSENHGPTDTKAEKLCIISPIHANVIALRLQSGTLIDSLAYFGPYSDGKSSRYYSHLMGHQIAALAIRSQGHPLVNVFMNGKQQATINPGFYENNL